MMLHRVRKRLILALTVLLLLATFLPSCSSSPNSPGSTSGLQLSGTITEAGSTTVQPLAEKLANAFTKNNPEVTITIQGGGTSVGIKSAADGTVDIGAASRELLPNEPQLVKFTLARDGIAIIVNPKNAVSGLTKTQVKDIFSGKITNWKDVGGTDAGINVAAREEGSGTRTAFEELVMGTDRILNKAVLQPSNGALRQVISGDANSISFVSLGAIDNSVKALAIDGVAATEANAASGAYPVVRPLYFLTKNQPAGLVKTFLDYCLGPDGESIVRSEGYVPVGK
jgi:phosphate transport system substrate-binding protein